MVDSPIRVGFVGAGANTRHRHIPGFQALPGVELVAVANRTRESGEKVAGEYAIQRVEDDWRHLVEAPDIDAVCIGTWPNLHRDVTVAALRAGKHVLCEARMARNADEGREMLAAAREAPDVVAQVVPSPFTLEFDSTLASMVGDGHLGDVLAVEVHVGQSFVDKTAPLHWRQDAGISGNNILTMGIWYEAMMRWLGTARRVSAMATTAVPRRRDDDGNWHEVKVPDHVDILATLGIGGVAHLRFSSVTGLAPRTELWIFGSEGTLRFEPDSGRLTAGRRGDQELSEVAVPAERRVGWRVEEEFVNAVRGREEVRRTTFEDGVRYMEFTDAVSRSAATGQTVDVADL
ncbi:Predicted dehydrogenase [Actinopolymorpha cephalotaxi]|uniref:Dehydrogenase n=1 Tax=Actinopolymorpha cephalotaxi TaxID=504797 RepID=A0A1I2ZW97_9ACTN|nr:Gfo/Idh/MocA family oxidoreductase [Actinopolymorpha cephalotaxi]NYH84196.1 putative dehydrogenase [Actinopolymorpha cephalotaxi]SFH41915.1 Predicted dehydrogenase [Actinopolymorpha cephalotaxi]